MLRVKFVVHCKKVKPNSIIKIVGNLPQLGEWNPLNGLVLEQYYEAEWQSTISIGIMNGKVCNNSGEEFDFKIIRFWGEQEVQWQQLPNNSNRKFKPKFHAKLILAWSNNIGHVLNEAKSSLKLHGLPGVMIKDPKGDGMLKRKQYKNRRHSFLSSESSEQENENGSFGCIINRKKSSDIRETISNGDIDEMYYDTTELETAYNNYSKTQVNIVCKSLSESRQFIEEIQEELRQLSDLQDFEFKWYVFSEDDGDLIKNKKLNIMKVEGNDRIVLDEYINNNVHRNYFIFLDLESALLVDVGTTLACVYLDGRECKRASEWLQRLCRFELICFNSGQANKQMIGYYNNKRIHSKCLLKYEQIQIKDFDWRQKQFQNMSIQKVIQQLQFCSQSEINLNTVSSFTKNETLANILTPNSILLIDSQLMKIDRQFYNNLTVTQCQKRLIIIIHKGMMAQWIYNLNDSKNICVIFDDFKKLYFVGKVYDPCLKHRDAIQFIRMRAKLSVEQIGGQWLLDNNKFVYKIKKGTQLKFESIKKQIGNFLKKDFNYFKIGIKENQFKITWNLSHNIRLLRTLVRIKCMEEGLIGDFYLVTAGQNFTQLKQQIKLLININHEKMIKGKQTRILDFGYGDKTSAQYHIKNGLRTVSSSSSQKSQGFVQEIKNKNKVLVN